MAHLQWQRSSFQKLLTQSLIPIFDVTFNIAIDTWMHMESKLVLLKLGHLLIRSCLQDMASTSGKLNMP